MSTEQQPDRRAYTIASFCRAFGISRSTYYKIPLEDRPREMLIGGGRAIRISYEAADEWRRKMESRMDEVNALAMGDGEKAEAENKAPVGSDAA